MDAIFPVARGPEPCAKPNPAEPEGVGHAPRAKRKLPKGPYSKPAPAAIDGGDGVSSVSLGKATPMGPPPRASSSAANPAALAKAVPLAPPPASAPTAPKVSQTERFAGLFLAFHFFLFGYTLCMYIGYHLRTWVRKGYDRCQG